MGDPGSIVPSASLSLDERSSKRIEFSHIAAERTTPSIVPF